MKFVTFTQKSFCGAVLSFLFMLVMGGPVVAQVIGTSGNNDPIRTNWENSMGIVFDEESGEMCVTLSEDNTVYIKISVFLMDPSGHGYVHPDISSLPPMHAEWELSADGVVINTGIMSTPFLATQFFAVSSSLPTLYKAVYTVPVNCSSLCTGSADTNGGAFCFKRRTRLLTPSGSGTWTPYPFGLYPAAWPPNYFPLVTSSFYTSPNLTEMKRVCCYGIRTANENCEPPSGGGLNVANNNNSGVGYAQQLQPSLAPVSTGNMKAYPNPFNSGFTLSYNQIEPGSVKVECLDMNGRMLKTIERSNPTPGSYEVTIDGAGLAAGVYYLRLSSPRATELIKIVKTDN